MEQTKIVISFFVFVDSYEILSPTLGVYNADNKRLRYFPATDWSSRGSPAIFHSSTIKQLSAATLKARFPCSLPVTSLPARYLWACRLGAKLVRGIVSLIASPLTILRPSSSSNAFTSPPCPLLIIWQVWIAIEHEMTIKRSFSKCFR